MDGLSSQMPLFPFGFEMEVFNPLIPLDVKSSSIPCGIFNLTASNEGDSPVEVSFLATQQNAIGIAGDEAHEGYGGNVNRVIRGDDATSIHMTHLSSPDEDMVLSAQVENACATASWTGLRDLHEAFSRDGELEYVESAGPSATGENGRLRAGYAICASTRGKTHYYLCSHLVFPQHRPWYAYMGKNTAICIQTGGLMRWMFIRISRLISMI